MPKVVYQGEPGAYSQKAVIELLGDKFTNKGLSSFASVFEAVEKGDAEYALVPIENSLGGSIHDNFDLLFRYNLHIIAEYNLRVRHCLVALKGVTKSDITIVKSHPQALAQCDGYIRKWGIKSEASYDTAGTAKMIKDKGLKDTAAICSSIAASIYDLQLLDSNIEDDENNYTRFLLLSKVSVSPPIDLASKTSIVFSMKNTNEPAALFKALSVFALRDLNLTKIESRPIKPDLLKDFITRYNRTDSSLEIKSVSNNNNKSSEADMIVKENIIAVKSSKPQFKYMFYCDFAASVMLESSMKAIGHLEEIALFVRVLGSFPCDGVLIGQALDDVTSLSKGTILSIPTLPVNVYDNIPKGSPILKIGILGFGRFGQFLGQKFAKYSKVFASSRGDYKEVAAAIGVTFCSSIEEMLDEKIDVLVLCTSILSFESVVDNLPKHKLRNLLVVDVLSVKQHAKVVLKKQLPSDCDILCTHPMFGPDSGKYTWKNLPFVFESVRISNKEREDSFLYMFSNEGCKMVELSCEAHDAYAAGSQFITHFTGRMLGELKNDRKLSSTPINTRGFETLLELVDNTCRDSFDLFYALFKYNSNSSEQLTMLNEAFGRVCQSLKSFDEKDKKKLSSTRSIPLEINTRVSDIAPSQTVYLAAKVSELERSGKKIHSLAIGEPDFPPPPSILEAVNKAMKDGNTGYTNVSGIFELRQEICTYLSKHKQTQYKPEQVLCTSGAKMAIFMALNCLVRPRDEVIIPAPYWVSYPDIVRLCGGTPIVLDTYAAEDYIINPEALSAIINPRSRIFILCNPSNPTGAVQPYSTLLAIAEVLNRPENKHIFIVADEIYERICFDEKHVSFASLPGMLDRTIVVNGMSKAYGMTGFRLGFMCGPSDIIDPCRKILSQTTHAPNTMAQYGGVQALKLDQSVIDQFVATFKEKRDFVIAKLREVKGLLLNVPQGAFYILPTVSSYFGFKTSDGFEIKDSSDFCLKLLEKYNVALTPGDAFCAAGAVRISYAASFETLAAAMDGIQSFCKELK